MIANSAQPLTALNIELNGVVNNPAGRNVSAFALSGKCFAARNISQFPKLAFAVHPTIIHSKHNL